MKHKKILQCVAVVCGAFVLHGCTNLQSGQEQAPTSVQEALINPGGSSQLICVEKVQGGGQCVCDKDLGGYWTCKGMTEACGNEDWKDNCTKTNVCSCALNKVSSG